MSKTQLLHKTARLLARQGSSKPTKQDIKHCLVLIEHIVSRLFEGGATAQYLPDQALRIYRMSLE